MKNIQAHEAKQIADDAQYDIKFFLSEIYRVALGGNYSEIFHTLKETQAEVLRKRGFVVKDLNDGSYMVSWENAEI